MSKKLSPPLAGREAMKSEAKQSHRQGRLVQMQLSDRTITAVDELRSFTGISNRTHIVAASIRLTHFLIKASGEKGGHVCLEYPDGSKETISLIL